MIQFGFIVPKNGLRLMERVDESEIVVYNKPLHPVVDAELKQLIVKS